MWEWAELPVPLFQVEDPRRFTLVLRPTLLALAAITAPLAFRAAMILADILGAIHADLGGRFFADTARKGCSLAHDSWLLLRLSVSLRRRRWWTRSCAVLVIPAPLRLPIHYGELLLVLRGQVCDVLPQLIALGGVLAQGLRKLIPRCGTLILARAFHQGLQAPFHALQPEVNIQRRRQLLGLLFQSLGRLVEVAELLLRSLPLRDISVGSAFLHPCLRSQPAHQRLQLRDLRRKFADAPGDIPGGRDAGGRLPPQGNRKQRGEQK